MEETILNFKDQQGGVVNAHVFSGAGEGAAQRFLAALDQWGTAKAGGEGPALSTQLPAGDAMKAYYDEQAVAQPPVLPTHYAQLYRRDPTHRACVNAKVRYIAMSGWRIRPRKEVWPDTELVGGGDVGLSPPGQEDQEARERTQSIFEAGLPEEDFADTLGQVWQDVETTGNGFVEILRNAQGRLAGFKHAKSITMRIALNIPAYLQVRGSRWQWFAKYGTGARAILLRRKNVTATSDRGVPLTETAPLWLPAEGQALYEAATLDAGLFEPQAAWHLKAAGQQVASPVNEMLHLKKFTPMDTLYGEPDIISAAQDFLGAQSARLFMLSYFDNATVPRLAIFVRGVLAPKTIKALEGWVKSQSRLDALNETLVLEVTGDTEVQIERLSSEQLKEDGGFLRYRAECDRFMSKAHGVPASIVYDLTGLNRSVMEEADYRWVEDYVRSHQRSLEKKFNKIIELEMETRDWVLDLKVPDLLSLETKVNIWNTLLQRGVISINEVRCEMQLPPLPGGDQPILFIPGQGWVPLGAFTDEAFVKGMLERQREELRSGQLKTPPEDPAKAGLPVLVAPRTEATGQLPEGERRLLAGVLEALEPLNRDDVRPALAL